jgi:acyl-CoA hydrolase
MTPRTPSESAVEMNQLVLPGHTNALGTAFGGTVLAWVDTCAAMSAQRHARRTVVTASFDAVDFISPIRLGQLVNLRAVVNHVGRSSMEVGVRVEAEDPLTGDRVHAMSAYVTFVALGPDNRPTAIPAITPETPEEELRLAEAKVRRHNRLELAKARHQLRAESTLDSNA